MRRTAIRLLAITLVISLLASCGQPSGSEPPLGAAPTGVITGTLFQPDGTPLANQQLTLARDDAAPSALQTTAAGIITTNAAGAFATDVNEAGQYVLTYRDVRLGLGAATTITVQDRDGTLSSDPVTMDATELGAITGTVSNQGAGILVYLAGTSYLALTDSDGDFAISNVPAGTYSVQAAIGASTGSSQNVTVASGATTSLPSGLTVGPIITSTSPSDITVSFDESSPDSGTLVEFDIRGSGFGDSQGLSILQWGNRTMPRFMISKWTETEITVRATPSILYDFFQFELNEPIQPLEAFAFSVTTTAGEATSDVVARIFAFVRAATSEAYPGDLLVDATYAVERSAPVSGLVTGVALTNGQARDPQTDEVVTTYEWNDPYSGSPESKLVARPDGLLPMVLTLDPNVDPRIAGQPTGSFALYSGDWTIAPAELAYAPTTFQGAIYADQNSTVPMLDDGNFSIRFAVRTTDGTVTLEEKAISLQPDGTYEVEFTAPPIASPADYLYVDILYQGVQLDGSSRGLNVIP